MRILVDARILSGNSGGVEQAIIGLASSFKELNDPDLEFVWLVFDGNFDWLEKYTPARSSFQTSPYPKKGLGKSFIRKIVLRHKILDHVIAKLRESGPLEYELPIEPSVVKVIDPDIIHFPLQFGFETACINIYQPHDLQHLHLKELFSNETLTLRKKGYTSMSKQATKIVVGNNWTKNDVEKNLKFAFGKVLNVPVTVQPIFTTDQGAMDEDLLPDNYILYPAAGWPHKNHLRLIHAFALAHKEEPTFKLVLTGAHLIGNQEISKLISELDLSEHVVVLGFVNPGALWNLYKGAKGVIVPTLFESASYPVWEALIMEVPVAASSVTSIPEQIQNYGKLFNPNSIEEIQAILIELMRGSIADSEVRNQGKNYALSFTSKNSALGFRYAYRQALGLIEDTQDIYWLEYGRRF